jgi:hypothetical protein
MQNRYVGDIGDYLKLSILRTLSPGYRLGVAWWLFTDETHNGDGRHVGYLKRPDLWRHLDPELFDALRHVVLSGQRNVRALRAPGLIPGAIYADDVIPTGGPIAQRLSARRAWLAGVQRALEQANVLFLDPDNGLEPAGFRPTALKSGKSIMLSELRELAMPGRCLIVYHHQSRRRGGHYAEIKHCAARLRASGFATVDALRARPYSPRVYLLLNAPADIRHRAEAIERHWEGLITWHPGSE